MLSNMLLLTDLYNRALEAEAAGQELLYYYYLGKIFRIILIVDPLKKDDFEQPSRLL